jgi:hypothetical protein
VAAGKSFDELERGNRLLYCRVTRFPVLLILGWFTVSHLVLGAKWVFIDNVNLLLHEGGHWMFRWGGETLYVLGGTLGQLLFPAAFAIYFYRWRADLFAAAVSLWWFGENFFGISRYMADAPVEELPLVGGDTHDWAFLFGRWHLISHARAIAKGFYVLGAVLTIAALAYCLYSTMRPRQRDLDAGYTAN